MTTQARGCRQTRASSAARAGCGGRRLKEPKVRVVVGKIHIRAYSRLDGAKSERLGSQPTSKLRDGQSNRSRWNLAPNAEHLPSTLLSDAQCRCCTITISHSRRTDSTQPTSMVVDDIDPLARTHGRHMAQLRAHHSALRCKSLHRDTSQPSMHRVIHWQCPSQVIHGC